MNPDYRPYIDDVGLIQNIIPVPGHWASGNGALYTAYALATMNPKDLTVDDVTHLNTAYNTLQISPGILIRHPLNLAQESEDDYLGACAASFILGNTLAKQIVAHGENCPEVIDGVSFYYYCPNAGQTNFDYTAWIGRFGGLVAFMQMAAGGRPDILGLLELSWSIAFGPWPDEDAPAQTWLQLKTAAKKSWICRLAGKRFYSRLYKKYPGGMKDVFGKMLGPNHPVTKYVVD